MQIQINLRPDTSRLFLFETRQPFLFFRWITRLALVVLLGAILTQCSDKDDEPEPGSSEKVITINGELRGPSDIHIGNSGLPPSASNLAVSAAKEPDTGQPKNSVQNQTVSSTGSQSLDSATGQSIYASATSFSAISGEVLLAGIEISLFRLTDYLDAPASAQPLAKVTTDTDGKFSTEEIPANTDILALAHTDPRLSAFYPDAGAQTNLTINTATTLAAEYYGPALNAGNTVTSQNIQIIIQRANEITEGMSGEELLNLLNGLVPEQFGEGFPGGLPPYLQEIVNRLNGIQQADCSEITFSAKSGKPGNIITIIGLPDEFGQEPYLLLYLPGEESSGKKDAFPVYLELTGGGEAEFAIPINPANPMEGGEVQLVIESEDETLVCSSTTFTIQPMEASPGVFSAMVDDLESGFIHLATSLDYNVEDLLVADVLSLPAEVMGIAFGLQAVAGPDVPNNLRAMATGEILMEGESQKLEPWEMELIEAIIAGIGMDQDIKALKNAMLEVDLDETKNLRNQLHQKNNDISPGTLQAMMLLQTSFENQNASTIRSLQNKVKTGIGVIGIGATLLRAPHVAAGAALLGSVATAGHLVYDMGEHLLPSKLADILLEANPSLYSEEDDGSEGNWETQLVATTNGYRVDLPSTIGALPGWGGISKRLVQMERLARFNPAGIGIGFDVTKDLVSMILTEFDAFGLDIPSEEYHVTFDPNRFGESMFFEWELRTIITEDGGPPFVFKGGNDLVYIPKGVGQSEINIKTTGGLIFKGQVVEKRQILELKPIEIEIVREIGPGFTIGSPFFLEVGEELPLQAWVRNAIEEKVEWTVSPNNGGIEFVELGPNELTIAGREPGNYIITAESLARTGARTNNQPVRKATAKVVVEQLRISIPGCIIKGEFHEFKAWFGDEQISFSELNWTISGPGNLSNTGLYSSPQTGQVQIEFSMKRNEDITAEVSFEVREKCPDIYDIYVENGPLARRYYGEIERDDDSDYGTVPNFFNQETLGMPGYTAARLMMYDPTLLAVMDVLFINGVPLPIGDAVENSTLVITLNNSILAGVSGSVSVSNFMTYVDFMGNESSWSGTIKFFGIFEADDESLVDVKGTFTVMPMEPDEDKDAR